MRRPPACAVAVAAAGLAACGAGAARAQPPRQSGPPAGGRVDTVALVVGVPGRAATTRLRGDTLWWVQPGAVFPRDTLDPRGPGTTDTLVVLFGRDGTGREVAWRLVGRTRRPLPAVLFPALREVRALAAEDGP